MDNEGSHFIFFSFFLFFSVKILTKKLIQRVQNILTKSYTK